jgi:hypothetical protein
MIIEQEKRNIEQVGEFGAQAEFSIENSPKAFRALIGGLYPDGARAILKEICANCADSHIAAGCPEKPFEISLPTQFEPNFIARDFGVSMSNEFMMTSYTKAFKSSKGETNEQTGSFGVGRLSGLAMCDSYFAICFQNGIKRSYSIFINQSGKPQIAFIGQENTDEPDGFLVDIPIPLDKIDEFDNKAKNIFSYYKVKPIIKNRDDFSIPENTYTILAEDGSFGLQGASSGSQAIMGPYCYPINKDFVTGMSEIQSQILNSGLVAHFEMGQLDIALNREGLEYTKKTISNIKSKIDSIIPQIEPLILNTFANKNVFEKMALFHDLLSYDGKFAGLSGLVKEVVKSQKIPNIIQLGKCGLEAFVFSYDSYKEKVKKSTLQNLTYDEHNVFYVTEKKIHLKAKAKKMFEDDSDEAIGKYKKIVFIKINFSGVKEFEKEYGFDLTEFKDAADLPFDKAIHINAGGTKTFKTLAFTNMGYGRRSRIQDAWAEEDLEEEDEILYIQRKGYGLADDYDKGKDGLRELQEKINKFKSITCDDTVQVFGLTARQIKDKGDSWRDFDTVYKEKLEEYKKKEEEKIATYKYFRANYCDWPGFLDKLNIDSSTECFKIIEEYKQLKVIAGKVNDSLANETKVKASNKFNYSCADLYKKYPLLKVVSSCYGELCKESKNDLSKYVNEKVIV